MATPLAGGPLAWTARSLPWSAPVGTADRPGDDRFIDYRQYLAHRTSSGFFCFHRIGGKLLPTCRSSSPCCRVVPRRSKPARSRRETDPVGRQPVPRFYRGGSAIDELRGGPPGADGAFL